MKENCFYGFLFFISLVAAQTSITTLMQTDLETPTKILMQYLHRMAVM